VFFVVNDLRDKKSNDPAIVSVDAKATDYNIIFGIIQKAKTPELLNETRPTVIEKIDTGVIKTSTGGKRKTKTKKRKTKKRKTKKRKTNRK
jgi:hypothetical protein